jgi:hypothetical protein
MEDPDEHGLLSFPYEYRNAVLSILIDIPYKNNSDIFERIDFAGPGA